jgi:putative ABC transport system permease protein
VTPQSRSFAVCTALLRAAAPLAPADLRRDWLREWEAELWFSVTHRRASARPSSARLMARCAGAPLHAAWLRWDRWRLDMLLQDIRYAVRTLVRKPGFAAMTILTLAVGIGGNAAIFSAVRSVLLRPLPFPGPDELVQIFSTTVSAPERAVGSVSPPDFTDWRRDNRSFSEMATINANAFALTGLGTAEQLPGAQVTGGFFNVLAVPALYGRTLLPEDDATGGPDVVVLAHSLWTRQFGSDPNAVGRTITLEGTSYRIVGVMPRGFKYPLDSELWRPQRFTTNDLTTQRGAHYLDVIGRRKPGVSLEQAR